MKTLMFVDTNLDGLLIFLRDEAKFQDNFGISLKIHSKDSTFKKYPKRNMK